MMSDKTGTEKLSPDMDSDNPDISPESFALPATPGQMQHSTSSESFAPLASPGDAQSSLSPGLSSPPPAPVPSRPDKIFKLTKFTKTTRAVRRTKKRGSKRTGGKEDEEVRESGMTKRRIVVMGIITLLLIGLMYSYVIPRTTLQVETLFHQSMSGNSVGVRLSNTGTRAINNLSADMEIFNDEGTRIHHMEKLEDIEIKSHESYEFSANFRGSQLERYKIVMTFEFESGGEDYKEVVKHTTDGDYMNENWKDRLP